MPPTAAEWMVASGALGLLLLAWGNVRRLGSGLRGFIRVVGGWDRKIDAVSAVAPIADQLKEIAEQFKTNGGGSLRDTIDRIDTRTASTAEKVDTAIGRFEDELGALKNETALLRREDEALAETIDRMREEQQHEAQVAWDVIKRLGIKEPGA